MDEVFGEENFRQHRSHFENYWSSTCDTTLRPYSIISFGMPRTLTSSKYRPLYKSEISDDEGATNMRVGS